MALFNPVSRHQPYFAVIHDASLVKHLEVRQDVVEAGINDSAEPGPINFRDVFDKILGNTEGALQMARSSLDFDPTSCTC